MTIAKWSKRVRRRWKWTRYGKSDRGERGNRVRGKSGGKMKMAAMVRGEKRSG